MPLAELEAGPHPSTCLLACRGRTKEPLVLHQPAKSLKGCSPAAGAQGAELRHGCAEWTGERCAIGRTATPLTALMACRVGPTQACPAALSPKQLTRPTALAAAGSDQPKYGAVRWRCSGLQSAIGLRAGRSKARGDRREFTGRARHGLDQLGCPLARKRTGSKPPPTAVPPRRFSIVPVL